MTESNLPVNQDVDEEAYDSAEDEDFELDAAPDDSDLSSDADETAEPAKKKRKTDPRAQIPEDAELDSGDEATIRKAKEKKERKTKGKKLKGKRARDSDEDDVDLDMDDDEGGTGGFVRTRAMKQQIQEEQRKPLARIDGATVDVDALWEQMNAPQGQTSLQPTPAQQITESVLNPEPTGETKAQDDGDRGAEHKIGPAVHADQMIKIKRTYKFAGEWITEEKVVPKHSAEAKAFLSSGEIVEYTDEDAAAINASRNLRRPLRKISRFDPNPTGMIKKSWEKQLVADARGPKINTVEKSRLDWATYVDSAGIKDELRTHSKAKEGYIGRMDFLGRMEEKREDERRAARLKGI
ncbi:Craniofacial development protein 1/Bucentaur [Penicillium cf. griseofulvum]|uniref:SWR1-complex protein 5 n=1 Tax=Penicillium cf. griseofulvum TaxID=2972120 RepID=A0A9W9M3W8_9EURO|nr:Craniofacial development protein 1/Bucentaur [Penicillium cf. griseofulvum]KAJ5422976.1 Craniofacial development protein 1/Bucentaur [Penicillium cf. griseofulvum]KAJ5433808.1 Craniofacial development protein 1/Bucentaur [Penicillium cf. griseofulvum]